MRKRGTYGGRPLHFQDKNRLTAARLLVKVEDEGAFAQILSSADNVDLSPKVREYVSGVTRWKRWLDFLVEGNYSGTFEEIEPLLKQVLRIGAYDLHLLRAPPHVAVSAAVAVASNAVGDGAGQLANAVLRRVAEQRESPPQPATGDMVEDLAIRWSHPSWLARRWVSRFGAEGATSLMQANNDRPWYGLRSNPFAPDARPIGEVLTELEVTWRPTLLDDFVEADRLANIVRAGLLESGSISVQDVAAAMAVRLLDPQSGETIIDACAAPGGKSTYAAGLMDNRGRIVAIDRNNVRLRLVRRSAGRQRIRTIETIPGEFDSMVDEILPRPDRILVDAPCTGLGVLARRPDLRWRKSEDDIEGLNKLQDRLLDRAATLLNTGGVLVYSTCTITPEENEETATRFLHRHPYFERESASTWLPEAVVADTGAMETLPHVHGMDGAFAVRFRRLGD
jgi:16S rRNA (cytosine967-C5)-methyltransferase